MNRKKYAILFVIRSTDLLFYYQSIVNAIDDRGHKLILLFDSECSKRKLESLKLPNEVTVGWAPRDRRKLRKIIYYLRDLVHYRRYLIVKGQSKFYRDRWLRNALRPFKPFIYISLVQKVLTSLPIVNFIQTLERKLPTEQAIRDAIGEIKPDVVVCSPANFGFTSADIEYLNTAKRMNIPTVVPVMSWDNLTTKGIFLEKPDLLLCWNEAQVKEAVIHHKISKKNVSIIGAPMFDYLFEKSKIDASLLENESIDQKLPIVLYLGSSVDVAGDERWLIEKLRESLDTSRDLNLGRSQLVFRPHPFNDKHYKEFKMKGVIVAPRSGSLPSDNAQKRLYLAMLDKASVVVGVNTSGLIDSVILDKPTIGLVVDKYKLTQGEAIHFKNLVESDALSLVKPEGFALEFENIIIGQDKHKKQRSSFINKFIRPLGLEKNAGQNVVDEIEKLVIATWK